ncbi:DUF2161 domain-containing phosphodiesterase [Paenibacillus guangzhouensis]|uniref:DUF2161 domain-containing phosphodiesterase n=1 Tax=Paenibacillus guangzhouensis TaxID=1473112 RepID=UPI001266EB87|nr:DUF2161 family putative PD-(D/E)XK-type phosphodiesterase [Paenibacillus guangzhouensis]
MAIQHETELYEPIKRFYEARGYTVKGEVRHCDLVAVSQDEQDIVIVEFKKTFNLALLLQGVDRMQSSEQVYLAVERNRSKKGAVNQRWGELTRLCKRLGLGLLTVTFYKTKKPIVEVLCESAAATQYITAPVNKPARVSSRRKNRLLQEFNERSGDYNVGGSTKRKLVTAYREKALNLAKCLHEHGQLSPRRLRELCGYSNTATMLQHNYYGWFARASRGIYELTPVGLAALEEYATVLREASATAQQDA